MPSATAIELRAAGPDAASGAGEAVATGIDAQAVITLSVSSAVGTGTLDVSIETSSDGTAWRHVGAFSQVLAAGKETLRFGDLDGYVRAVWAIDDAAPTFTFAIAGTSLRTYARLSDLAALGVPAAALVDLSVGQKLEALAAASDDVTSALSSGGYTPPLTAWGSDVRGKACDLAAFTLMSVRGFNPEGADQMFVYRNDKAVRWLEKVATEQITPAGIVDSTPDEYDGGAFVVSRQKVW